MLYEVITEEQEMIKDLCLMTMKPILYAINVDEAELSSVKVEELGSLYSQRIGVNQSQIVIISAKIEAELAEMSQLELYDECLLNRFIGSYNFV